VTRRIATLDCGPESRNDLDADPASVKGHAVQITAVLTPADEGFGAFNPDTGTTTQGDTIEAALANLREAVELFLEEYPMPLGGAPLVTTVSILENA
jgi:predicted RNase H-like HicB family nuclease